MNSNFSLHPEIRILITGGGTGGHTTPAIATLQAIKEILAHHNSTPLFLYLGSKHGVERKIASELGVDFAGIETGKLRRSRHILGLVSRANITDALRVPVGYVQALRYVRKFRPDVVLSTGGYVSVAGVLAARAFGIPVVAHEQTVQVGLANRVNFQGASKIALSFAETLDALKPNQRARAVVTGNPVRTVIFGGDRDHAAKRFGFDPADKLLPTVYVTGGAQGSRIINQAVLDKMSELTSFCRIIHQCGVQTNSATQDYDHLSEARAKLPASLQCRYTVVRYIGSEIGDVYALADLVIGRSGAGTVSEVCALGKPALFIPLVPTGGDEQTRNAGRLVNAGAAAVVRQDELSGDRLLDEVRDLLSNRQELVIMGERARKLSSPDAANRLANLVIELGAKKSK